ncbi:MAG: rRNA maturation RNase YbeY [Planctomycetota bacterium]
MSPSARNSALDISIAWRLRSSWSALQLLDRVARHVAAAEKFKSGQLSIAIVGQRAMRTLHQRYLAQSGPTDVLAFDLGCDPATGILDGEIIICADVARRRARAVLRQKIHPTEAQLLATARHELALYLTHGILHLAGYEDHTPAGFRRMHAREDQLLGELGLGPIFARGNTSG